METYDHNTLRMISHMVAEREALYPLVLDRIATEAQVAEYHRLNRELRKYDKSLVTGKYIYPSN